jgi:hypothetical protein
MVDYTQYTPTIKLAMRIPDKKVQMKELAWPNGFSFAHSECILTVGQGNLF